MDFAKLKSFFLKIMIGCLTAAGMLAVITVLTGHFNEIFGRSLLTILLVAVHALVSFGYIDISERRKSDNELTFFHNTTLLLIILSFITSIFGLWGVVGGELVGKLYVTYGVLLFAALHGETLSKMIGKETTTDNIIYANYVFMVLVILFIMPVIYMTDTASLGDGYFRLLAAFGIIDAVLTLIAIILNKLYLQKHPKVVSPLFNIIPGTGVGPAAGQQPAAPKRGMNILVVILLGFLGIQLLGSVIFAVIGREAARNIEKTKTTQTTQTTTPTPRYPSTSAGSNYSYESDFTYDGVDYTCSQRIAGSWTRLQSSTGAQDFSFVPINRYDLTTYCQATNSSYR